MNTAGLAAFRALALAATEGVTDDGYRLRAPDGALIVEYKHSLHPNAGNDGALFTQARPIVLALLDHIADLETQRATLVTAVREHLVAADNFENAGWDDYAKASRARETTARRLDDLLPDEEVTP